MATDGAAIKGYYVKSEFDLAINHARSVPGPTDYSVMDCERVGPEQSFMRSKKTWLTEHLTKEVLVGALDEDVVL